MKSFVILFSLFICIHRMTFGKIINGYGNHIQEAREMLTHFQTLLKEDTYQDQSLTFLQKNRLKVSMKQVSTYILYYQLTEILLERFSTMAPDLFNEIDGITDAKGRHTDVYVKFMPEEEMQVSLTGTTDMGQAADDVDRCVSEYGIHTVSVKIGIKSNALEQLAHEFGHIQYQVPHLATYVAYYQKHYRQRGTTIQCIGHRADDPSGQCAHDYEKKFWQQSQLYNKTTSEKSPKALLLEIRQAMNKQAYI